jgi:hypothetical protein
LWNIWLLAHSILFAGQSRLLQSGSRTRFGNRGHFQTWLHAILLRDVIVLSHHDALVDGSTSCCITLTLISCLAATVGRRVSLHFEHGDFVLTAWGLRVVICTHWDFLCAFTAC